MAAATAIRPHPPLALVANSREPQQPSDALVVRPRLVSRLVSASAVAVALIAAPAGYGKTTLLDDWAARDERPFARIAVDASHNDAARLRRDLMRVLDEVAPRAGRMPRARRARLLEGRGPLVLALDDIHRLQSDDARALLRDLANAVPPSVQLALASRTEPSLPLGRLRAQRALVELRARDLAMTAAETATLLSMAGADLRPAEVEMLLERTEGWPAGLYLAALSVRDDADPTVAAARFGGSDFAVAEYLRDEVLSLLSPDQLDFLTYAAVLDRLTAATCDAVLRRRDSARLLTEIARSSLLLVPLDRSRESYRCHRLLAQALGARRGQLMERSAEAELHRRAGAWYAAHGDVERAIEHATAAVDVDGAGRLIWALVPSYVTHGRSSALKRWLGHFSEAQVESDACLSLSDACAHLAMGELAEAERSTWSTCRVLRETPVREPPSDLAAGLVVVRAVLSTGGVERMGAEAREAYELAPEDSPWRAASCYLQAISSHLTGARDDAERLLEEGARRSAIVAPSVHASCLGQLALLAIERDDWETAVLHASRATAELANYGLGRDPGSALVYAASALVRTRGATPDSAHDDIKRARRLLAHLGDLASWYDVAVRVVLAQAMLRVGEVAEARRLVVDARRGARRVGDAVVLSEWLGEAETSAAAVTDAAAGSAHALTAAEVRILHFLPTHLSFREIASRLYVSANTVKTQAHAVYRKLDVSSRSEAVARAAGLGLIDG